jgi:hypothetical protein
MAFKAHPACWQDARLALQDTYVEDLIKRLGLGKSADTIVGDAKTRGISGEHCVLLSTCHARCSCAHSDITTLCW